MLEEKIKVAFETAHAYLFHSCLKLITPDAWGNGMA